MRVDAHLANDAEEVPIALVAAGVVRAFALIEHELVVLQQKPLHEHAQDGPPRGRVSLEVARAARPMASARRCLMRRRMSISLEAIAPRENTTIGATNTLAAMNKSVLPLRSRLA